MVATSSLHPSAVGLAVGAAVVGERVVGLAVGLAVGTAVVGVVVGTEVVGAGEGGSGIAAVGLLQAYISTHAYYHK